MEFSFLGPYVWLLNSPLVSWGLWMFWGGSPDGPACLQPGIYCGSFCPDQGSIAQACCLKAASTETLKFSGLSHLTE